jgi:phosphohistidine phosphatase
MTEQETPSNETMPEQAATDAPAPAAPAEAPAVEPPPAGPDAPAATAPDVARAAPPQAQGFELYLLRHADAGDPAEWAGDDADRPLSKRGRRQSKQLGAYLRDLKVRPGAILTSPKVRAADTAKLVGKRLGAAVTTDQRLGGGFEAAELSAVLDGLDPGGSCAILVGHDPDFSSLLSWLVGAPLALRKGALARTDLPDRSIGPGRGSLRWLLPPDAIPG